MLWGTPPCRHHWIIQPAESPVSLGVCRLCLEEKEFHNAIYPEHTKASSRLAADFDEN